jgi:hypothetical protein
MAYIKAEEVKQIREKLKKEFPKIKFSITRDRHICIDVSILKSDIDFSDIKHDGYFTVNKYYLHEYPEHHKNLFTKIIDIIKNVMTDYFHTAFYFDLNIGKYGKPYIKTN